ncbi:hypothetical protein SDA67_15200, partial [Legionella pneumophila serogroup 1]
MLFYFKKQKARSDPDDPVNNDLAFSTSTSTGNSKNDFSAIAKQQFGVPYKANGEACTEYQQVCQTWGSVPSSTGSTTGVLFN